MQWRHLGSHPPKKFKRVSSAGKVMASVFWDSQVVSRMINGAYNAAELRRLRQEIARKRRGKLARGVLILILHCVNIDAQIVYAKCTLLARVGE